MTPTKLLYALALLTALALALVWQSARIRQSGYRVAELRAQIAEQKAELALHEAHLSKLRSPQRIVGLARWLGLELEQRAVVAAHGPEQTDRPQPAVADESADGTAGLIAEPVAALPSF